MTYEELNNTLNACKKYISTLEKEIKRLKKENENTFKIKVSIGDDNYYEVDTQLILPKPGIYYLPTDNINPMKVRLVDYILYSSLDGDSTIMATINIADDTKKGEVPKLIDTNPKLLFHTKNQASDYYLFHKDELDFSELRKV